MNKDRLLAIITALLGGIIWLYPNIPEELKWIILLIATSIIAFIFLKDRISYFTRKFWQEIISVALLVIGYLIFKNVYPFLLEPAAIVVLVSSAISILISSKYKGNLVYRRRRFLFVVPIDGAWDLNHWGSNFASINNGAMIFQGSSPINEDGSNVDLLNQLNVGTTYEVSCLVNSTPNTTAKFRLWCHDKTTQPNGISEATNFLIPSTSGQRIKLIFKATFNKNIRIHLQYLPGTGTITVNDIQIAELI